MNLKFEKYCLNKLNNKELLSKEDLKTLVDFYNIDTVYDENCKYYRKASTVIYLQNKYYIIEWEEALDLGVPYGLRNFPSQPYEVEQVIYESTVPIKVWKRK